MTTISPEQLLAEVEDILRTMPPAHSLGEDSAEVMSWLGRASAAVHAWNPIKATTQFDLSVSGLGALYAKDFTPALRSVLVILNQARFDLRLRTVGPLSINVATGAVFDYFDEVRKVVEAANTDLLFVDPYLDADFISRYLPHVKPGTTVRLLAREKMPSLIPAVQLMRTQSALSIEVRSASGFHDRYLLTDGIACYQSGASFKDGAKSAPTTLTQITDAFAAVRSTYEALWASAKLHP